MHCFNLIILCLAVKCLDSYRPNILEEIVELFAISGTTGAGLRRPSYSSTY